MRVGQTFEGLGRRGVLNSSKAGKSSPASGIRSLGVWEVVILVEKREKCPGTLCVNLGFRGLGDLVVGGAQLVDLDGLRRTAVPAQRSSVMALKGWLGSGYSYVMSTISSTWLHIATNRSKNNLLPPISISICMVPLRLKVLRLRIISAKKCARNLASWSGVLS